MKNPLYSIAWHFSLTRACETCFRGQHKQMQKTIWMLHLTSKSDAYDPGDQTIDPTTNACCQIINRRRKNGISAHSGTGIQQNCTVDWRRNVIDWCHGCLGEKSTIWMIDRIVNVYESSMKFKLIYINQLSISIKLYKLDAYEVKYI